MRPSASDGGASVRLRLGRIAVFVTLLSQLCACAVVTVAGAAAGAAISVTGAVVSTGIKVGGKAVGATIDAVSPSKKEE